MHVCSTGMRFTATLDAINSGASTFWVGAMLASISLGPMCFAIPSGRWLDRGGPRGPLAGARIGMMLAAYGIDVLLSLVLQLGTSLIGELPVPNNDTVTGLAKVDYKRVIAVAVLMAPLVEECLFRGVVFGTIRPRSRFWAYAASIALFSLYHVWQYVIVYSYPKLLLSALAYVPVSAALTFCYEQTRSIWPPVFFHMFVNALSLAVLAG